MRNSKLVRNAKRTGAQSVPAANAAFFSGVAAFVVSQVEYQSRLLRGKKHRSLQPGRIALQLVESRRGFNSSLKPCFLCDEINVWKLQI